MVFSKVETIGEFESYIYSHRGKWFPYYCKGENDFEVVRVYNLLCTPLVFVTKNGILYFLKEYRGKYNMGSQSCFYLSHFVRLEKKRPEMIIGLSYEEFYSIIYNLDFYGELLGYGKLKNPKFIIR